MNLDQFKPQLPRSLQVVEPSREEIEARRRQIEASRATYILDPYTVGVEGEIRIRNFAGELMRKNEHKFHNKIPDRKVVTSGDITPEAIDVKAIYPFKDLNWVIWRNKSYWSFMLLSEHRLLFNLDFLKIDEKFK